MSSIPDYTVTITQDSTLSIFTLKLFGSLVYSTDQALTHTLTMSYAYISGSFSAGTIDEPFLGRLTINLNGENTLEPYTIQDPPRSDGTIMGSKAIGKSINLVNPLETRQ